MKQTSKIKVDAIAAIEKSMTIKRIGRLDKTTLDKVKKLLRTLLVL